MNTFRKRMKKIASIPLAAVLLLSASAFSSEWRAFDHAAFLAAKNSEKTVVLDFHADWCPTCQKQKPILEQILREKEFGGVVGFQVNYDTSADLKK